MSLIAKKLPRVLGFQDQKVLHHANHEYFTPNPLKDFVDHQITEGRYSSVSEYIRDLIRDDEKREAEMLEALLLEGLESEESELTRHDFDDIHKEALAQLKRKKNV
jgi:antitoxin ParD1/3/4